MKTLQEAIEEQRKLSKVHTVSQRSINAKERYEEYNNDPEWKEKVSKSISDATKNIPKTDEGKQNMSNAAKKRPPNQTGRKRTPEQIENIRNGISEEGWAKKLEGAKKGGEWHAGKPKPKRQCPHCHKMIAANMFDRYHNDNCKLKS